MAPWTKSVLMALATIGVAASAGAACQERILSLPFAPQPGSAVNWCWAATGQMIMELLGEPPRRACQCRQAERVLGVKGCCVTPGSCIPPNDLPLRCDEPRWPAFVERPEQYGYSYATTCDAFPRRQDDEACDLRPLAFAALAAEICAGRPVIASFRARGSARGHAVVVKGVTTRPGPRVLVVDPLRLCSEGRDCEGELDEAFWMSYDEYAAGWDGRVHWVDFYRIKRRQTAEK
jgi:hypothetical protein